jgi:hypothetical protein
VAECRFKDQSGNIIFCDSVSKPVDGVHEWNFTVGRVRHEVSKIIIHLRKFYCMAGSFVQKLSISVLSNVHSKR